MVSLRSAAEGHTRPIRPPFAPLAVAALIALLAGCGGDSSSDRSGPSTTTDLAPGTSVAVLPESSTPATTVSGLTAPGEASTTVTLLAAGDIGDCSSRGDEATAVLLDARPEATVATLGDLAYDSGTAEEFAECYAPTWGRHRARTRPAPGNHEYETTGAAGYFSYWGAVAGEPGKGYYSYDLGAWHVVVVNSNCDDVDCSEGGPQERWLRADLAAHPTACTLAYGHHPRFSSGDHGSEEAMGAIWTALYDSGADLVLAGHDHNYERLAPLDDGGAVDEARGIRSFVVGTGGKGLREFDRPVRGSEVRNDDTFGVLALTLRPTGYDWEFLPVAGRTFTDRGSDDCH